MGIEAISPLFADVYHAVKWGAQALTTGGYSHTVVSGKWLGCLMPFDNMDSGNGGAEYILDSIVCTARTGTGGTAATEAKVGVWKTTDGGTTWDNVFEIDITTEWNAAPTGSFAATTFDLTGTAEASRTFTNEGGASVQYAWGIAVTNNAGGGCFLKNHNDSSPVGPQTALWLRANIDNTDDLATIDSGDFETGTNTRGDVGGYAVLRTKEKRWCRIDGSAYAGTAQQVRVPWSDDAYSVLLKNTVVPDTITLTADLMDLNDGAERKLADFDVAIASGTDKVTFGATPADLAFDTTHGRPDSDAIDYLFNIYPDSSNVACELGRRNTELSEGGVDPDDLLWRAHKSAVAAAHNSNDTLSAAPTFIDFAAAAGATVEDVSVGRPLFVISDSQASENTGALGPYRLTDSLDERMTYPQEVILIATPGGVWAEATSARTATADIIKHGTPATASAISVMKGCDVLFVIGVNDVSQRIAADADWPEFVSDFMSKLFTFYNDLTEGDNEHDNRIILMGLPDWPGASTQAKRDAVRNLGRAISGAATALRAPFYDPYDLSVGYSAVISSDNIHYEVDLAPVPQAGMLQAWQGDQNDTTRSNVAPDEGSLATTLKGLLFDAGSQDNRMTVDSSGRVTSTTLTPADVNVTSWAGTSVSNASGRPNVQVGGLESAALTEITDEFGAGANVYTARVSLAKDGSSSEDTYGVALFLNGEPITSGVTSPTITVTDAAGTTVINAQSLSDAGGHRYVYVATGAARVSEGDPVFVDIAFTHSSGSRSFRAIVARDAA